MEKSIKIQYFQTICGELILGSYNNQLCLCDWVNEKRRTTIDSRIQKGLQLGYEEQSSEVIAETISQLNQYFNKQRTVFDIPLLFVGTDFQKQVWNMLLEIPYGTTESYGELSKRMNNPKAVRAVAAANGANAISILVPCHRIIGGSNQLVGYAGGLGAKKILLDLESSLKTPQLEFASS